MRTLFMPALAAALLSACAAGEVTPAPGAAETEETGSAQSALAVDHKARSLSAGMNHACAVLKTGALKCWGENAFGRLGLGDTEDRGDSAGEMGDALPASFGQGISAVTAGYMHTCALYQPYSSTQPGLKCWGLNSSGQLGQPQVGNRGDEPREMFQMDFTVLGAGRSVKSAESGSYHTCAVLDNDELKCWGYNTFGQLGLGDVLDRGDSALEMNSVPTIPLGTGRTAKAVATGESHTCALLDNNQVKCWGLNVAGSLGLGDLSRRGHTAATKPASLPVVQLGGPSDEAKAIAVGGQHTCAILPDDTVKCWGGNDYGELGQGHTNSLGGSTATEPEDFGAINLGGSVSAISAGGEHTCALLSNGTVKCWGRNDHGQLGLGHTQSYGDAPGEVAAFPAVDLGPGRTAKAIAAGVFFTCALLDTDDVKCWGGAASGALGHPGCAGATPDCGDEAGEMGAALPAVDLGDDKLAVGGCGAPTLVLRDGPMNDPNANQLCLHGTGTLPLATLPRGTTGTWAGAVESFYRDLPPGDPNRGGLLSQVSCATYDCPSQHFTGADSAGWVDADENAEEADLVTLFHLKAPIRNEEFTTSAPGFIIADSSIKPPVTVAALAQESTFVWKGDRYTNDWTAATANPDILVGHYMPVSGVDDGLLARCQTDSDCLLEGYHCVTWNSASNPATYYYHGEKVCWYTSSEMRACDEDADCKPTPTSDLAGVCAQAPGGTQLKCFHSLALRGAINYSYWDAVHPEWILRRCTTSGGALDNLNASPVVRDRKNAAYWGVENPALDFTNEEVVQEMLSRIRAQWARGLKFDALSLDVVKPANYVGACGVYENGTTWVPLFKGDQRYNPACSGTCDPEDPSCAARDGYCDWQYTRAVAKWLKRLRDEMHKDGKRLHINLASTGGVHPAYSISSSDATLAGPGGIFDTVDGVLTEEGFNYAKCGAYSYDLSPDCLDNRYDGKDVHFWSNMRGYMLGVQSRSKPFYLKTGFPTADHTTPPTTAQIEWALASYLVSEAGLASIYVTPYSDATGYWDYAQLGVELDAACGAAAPVVEAVGARKGFTRAYRHGFVAVNFGAPTPAISPLLGGNITVSLPAGTFFKWNSSTGEYDAPVDCSNPDPALNDCVIPPQQGRVFVQSGAPLCP
ncbi:RCC1 domain-containing protein [Sorangium sp. So ce385]|uniref:RCC1 domain-containing protein n=1 Tax=Sorangium sp. So ce385 TaxID=3133308 RepID=UPI003F5CBA7F